MNGAPWFKFFPASFMESVAEFTPDERGAYISLLCHQWHAGDLPADRMRMERLAGGPVSDTVAGKFVPAAIPGRVFNVRLEASREEAQRRSIAGKKAVDRREELRSTEADRPIIDRSSTDEPSMHQRIEDRGKRLEDRGERPEPEATGGYKGGKEKKPKAEPVFAPIECPDLPPQIDAPEVRELFRDWLAMRKATKKPATIRAVSDAVADLVRFGGKAEAIACLKKSIARNWTGLFRPDAADIPLPPEAKRYDKNGRELF